MSYENCTAANSCSLGPSLVDVCSASTFFLFMSSLDASILNNDAISGINQRVNPVETPDDEYDFVVIGGGAGGSVVASRLSENREWKVLLLEAGHDEPIAMQIPGFLSASFRGTEVDWQYRTTNESNACLATNGTCYWYTAKMLGGCTGHNAMLYVRGSPTDYNNWAKLGNVGWTWDDVKPYFLKGEDNREIERVGTEHHSTGGPLSVGRFPHTPAFADVILAAAAEAGHSISDDLNGDQNTGFTVTQTANKNGVRCSSAAAYLRPARDRENLHVSLNSLATKVIIKNQTAVGVQYYKNGVLKTVRVTHEVILSAGNKKSPFILLHSGIGPREHLDSVGIKVVKDLPGVGGNVHDHIAYDLSFTINDTDVYNNDWNVAEEYKVNQTGALSSTGLTQVIALLPSSRTTPDFPDIEMSFSGYGAGCAPGEVGALRSTGGRSIGMHVTYLHPKSRGRISLASNDPLDGPVIWANYFDDDSDLEGLAEGLNIAMGLADTETFKAYNFTLSTKPLEVCSDYTFLSSEYWKCALRQGEISDHHDVGTCKMGPESDDMAVVDPQLRVRGIKGLRVADASVMPQGSCIAFISDSTGMQVSSRFVCIGQRCGDSEVQNGDSGGPLQYPDLIDDEPKYIQYGIVAFGTDSCGVKGYPGVYTRVIYYMDWILDTMTE